MSRPCIRFSLFASLLLSTAACTQPSAQIDLKGQNSYSKDGANNYASNYNSYSPASGKTDNTTYQAAPAARMTSAPATSSASSSSASSGSIGVSDLSAPTGARSAASSTPAPSSGGRSSWSAPHSNLSSGNSPFKAAQPADKQEERADANSGEGAVNPWTKKPRETAAATDALDESFNIRPQAKAVGAKKEQMVSEVKIVPISEQKQANLAKLDRIVDNDGSYTPVKKVEEKVAEKSAPVEKITKAESTGNSAFMWPVNSKKVISGYGPKGSGKVNDGINIASADGEPVWAASDGEIVYVGNELQGYGNMVLIKHGKNKTTSYAHLSRFTVEKYDRVKQGDIIGYVGSTGSVKAPQLHFAIRDGKEPVDPMKLLGKSVASIH